MGRKEWGGEFVQVEMLSSKSYESMCTRTKEILKREMRFIRCGGCQSGAILWRDGAVYRRLLVVSI